MSVLLTAKKLCAPWWSYYRTIPTMASLDNQAKFAPHYGEEDSIIMANRVGTRTLVGLHLTGN